MTDQPVNNGPTSTRQAPPEDMAVTDQPANHGLTSTWPDRHLDRNQLTSLLIPG